MNQSMRIASVVPGYFLLAALLALPGGASAQRLWQRESLSLSAAIEEARRSPFHAHDRVRRSADDAATPGTDPAALFFWHGSAHPAAHEVGERPQAGADRRGDNDLPMYVALGVAGDFLAGLVLNEPPINLASMVLSLTPATAVAILAGAHPWWAFAASSLGLASGVGAGHLVVWALARPLYIAAAIPAVFAYYGVRGGVTLAILRWRERREGR